MNKIITKGREKVIGITIDSSNSVDLDDAFWLEKDNEAYILHISIADVSALVIPDSKIDIIAKKRCFTEYFKNRNKPMLPRRYSEGSLSLLYNKDRPAITISIPINSMGETKTPVIRKTIIRNIAKLSYEQADQIMKSPNHQYNNMILKCHEIAQNLFQKRRIEGAITIYSLRHKLTTSEEGIIRMLSPDERFNSHIIVQEFMILVNSIIAKFFANKNIYGLYRNHTSKVIAPNRKKLIEDVNNVINIRDLNRIETLVRKFTLIFNKAQYSPVVEGHFSLNLPAYLHFTSPIRRYADFINVQQLSYYISNKNLPYSFSNLEEIGNHINNIALSIKNKKESFFKQQAHNFYLERLNDENFLNLKDKNYYRLIKTAIEENILPKNLQLLLESRLNKNKISVKEIFIILLNSNNPDKWQTFKNKIFRYLIKHPHHTISIFTLANQKFSWNKPEYTTIKTNIKHIPVFQSNATINLNGQSISSNSIDKKCLFFKNKKASRLYANLILISLITNIKINLHEIQINESIINLSTKIHNKDENFIKTNIEKDKNKIASREINHIGILYELCQENRWENPEFIFNKSGMEHQPVFYAIAKITINNIVYLSKEIKEANKKTAKQLAAADLLSKISYLPVEKKQHKKKPKTESRTTNYIGMLNTLLEKKSVKKPEYSFVRSAIHNYDRFQCTCSAILWNDILIETTGYGKTKKVAKHKAAFDMWKKITGMIEQ